MNNKLLYKIFHDESVSLFTKKFWHILLQSMRRVDNDKETLKALQIKHCLSSWQKELRKKRPAAKYLSNGETVWELKK